MRKNYIVWWTTAHSEEHPPGKLTLTEHVTWAAPPGWRARRVDLWVWISPLCCSMEGRAAYGIPRLRLSCGARESSAMCSPGPFAHMPWQGGSCCAPRWQARAGQVGYDCSTFVLLLLYPLPILTFLGQESSWILCSLCPPLQSLFWHSSCLSWLSKFALRMTSCGRALVPKVIFRSRGFILVPSQKDNLPCFSSTCFLACCCLEC